MKLAYCTLNGRNQHRTGRELLRNLYLEETGNEPPAIRLTKTGYPYFPDSPYYFSISHTSRHVFCVLSTQRVGIDAEELDRIVRPSLPSKVLSPSELEQYTRAADRQRAFLTFWVLKEAQAKCRGTGLRGFPNRTGFSLDDPRVTEIDGCVVAIIEEPEGEQHAL